MNNRIVCLLLLIGLFFTSCVPTKDLIYLQDKGNSKEEVVNQSNLKPYRLQTNDILSINIKALDARLVEMFNAGANGQNQESLYFTGYSVDDHGNIRIPVLGEMNVLGYTIEEVRKKIEERLLAEHFKTEAQLFVNVKLAGLRYTINGEIGLPGTKVLYQDKVNILEAVANAGDIAITGDRKDVKVIRQFPQGAQTFSIDLTDAVAAKSNVYYLQPNDYIYIKPLKQKTWGTGKTGIESLGTIITLLSLATTTFLLLRN
ncbi:polysaccharide biosynthesis/export family protein [Flavobacterium aquatile]|uniref:Sugar transporter n=1 Tax=Flavobacterium aquatile LMG 4008 = ATCC 11947 TaxID=1453498 RepID=A0A095STZ5_9FLAO|nr:polysaccharide biosynthesis/export family protein [Flavobacterium aquatile]KGD68106.1 sugar transporter [Flavobacterium aquatile LMG 4008 = ATCC 11947]OXA68957.1 sugar transporter [Flavobacterium aquatile] [Flavobacterium aquatile LMG 4008 = ATCC 11947]GEC77427.1 sugar transporter [Flavobacterium aquatile]